MTSELRDALAGIVNFIAEIPAEDPAAWIRKSDEWRKAKALLNAGRPARKRRCGMSEDLVCVLCGVNWVPEYLNRCPNPDCRGFCSWGKAKGGAPSSWRVREDGSWMPIAPEVYELRRAMRSYRGITYPHRIIRFAWQRRLWRRFMCRREIHLFDEVAGSGGYPCHYLSCDACDLAIVIDCIDEKYSGPSVKCPPSDWSDSPSPSAQPEQKDGGA